MATRVEGIPHKGDELDCKRFRIPGVRIESDCPNCGVERTVDLTEHYLSYPKLGVPENFDLYCDECDHEWSVPLVLEISLKVAE